MDAVDVTASVRKVSRIGDARMPKPTPKLLHSSRTPIPCARPPQRKYRPETPSRSIQRPFPYSHWPSTLRELRSVPPGHRGRTCQIGVARNVRNATGTGASPPPPAELAPTNLNRKKADAPCPMPARETAGAGDDNFSALGADDEELMTTLPRSTPNLSKPTVRSDSSGSTRQRPPPPSYLFANAPAPHPCPPPLPPKCYDHCAADDAVPQPAPAPLAQHAPFPGFPTRDQLANETPPTVTSTPQERAA
ncbi:hypothetical protein B0H13DRAFT_2298108 [Mycena leptocephala]|nr:hypothetical protein B0H13DRAFT_2298108 [Mycena leptocephala]